MDVVQVLRYPARNERGLLTWRPLGVSVSVWKSDYVEGKEESDPAGTG